VLKAIDFFIALVPCSYCFISDRQIEFCFSSIASYLLLNVGKLQKVQRKMEKLKIKRLNVEIGHGLKLKTMVNSCFSSVFVEDPY